MAWGRPFSRAGRGRKAAAGEAHGRERQVGGRGSRRGKRRLAPAFPAQRDGRVRRIGWVRQRGLARAGPVGSGGKGGSLRVRATALVFRFGRRSGAARVRVTLWQDGYQVGDGPLRDSSSPEGKAFMEAIARR